MTRDREPINPSRRHIMTAVGIAGLAALTPFSVKANDPDMALVELWRTWRRARGEAETLTQAASEAWSRAEDAPNSLAGSRTRSLEDAECARLAAQANAACAQLDQLEQQIVAIPAQGPNGIAAKLEVALDHLDEADGRAGAALRAAAQDARALGAKA